MRPKDFKGRCIKRSLSKCDTVVRTYDKVQTAYADVLESDGTITSYRCNVLLSGLPEGEYTTDFLCRKADGSYMVRECVFRKKLILPKTAKLLDLSREYWQHHGVTDWGIVVEREDG